MQLGKKHIYTAPRLAALAAGALLLNACGPQNDSLDDANSAHSGEHKASPLRDSLPVLRVVKTGATFEEAQRLFDALRLEAREDLVDPFGQISFVDSARFHNLPKQFLGTEKSDEDGQQVTLEALDFAAIERIQAIPREEAIGLFVEALDQAGLVPDGSVRALPDAHHTAFEAADVEGRPFMEVNIDTGATVAVNFEETPLFGPGNKISATFDDRGAATQVHYAYRAVEPGKEVAILPEDEARARCAQSVLAGHESLREVSVAASLVYYAPPLAQASATHLVPYFICNASSVVGGEEIALLNTLIPATDEKAYVPQLQLDASSKGDTVTASVSISGGTAPYSIEWISSSVALGKGDNEISYRARGRAELDSETITATITDANGVFVSTSATLPIAASKSASNMQPKVGGVRDFGAENAVNNEFGRLDKGFVDQMQADGVTKRFVWLGTNAWEQDFKAPEDSKWIDNTDITFYVGHGYGGGFTFEDNSHDDGALDYNDADDDWGDKDLEWLSLLSCRVLQTTYSGMHRFTRWKQEFDGLHLLLGFHTLAYAWNSFSGKFASNMVDHNMTVQQAWLSATASDQPDCVEPVVMGVFRKGDGVSNSGDHFWGKGSVGPDIRDGDIGGYWSLRVLSSNPCN